MTGWFQKQWATYTLWHVLLIPLSWLFSGISHVRKALYKARWLTSCRLRVPVIVVGNINVGGTGKTPVVIWLAEKLLLAGYKPGIISRGYGGKAKSVQAVFAHSSPQVVGDEPVLIAQRSRCPVFVSRDRVAAGQALLKAHPECTIIISDDGLQHYRLQRDIEIVVLDGAKGLGNEALLPAGPLRESKARLNNVDAVVMNGKGGRIEARLRADGLTPIEMQLESGEFYNLLDSNIRCNAQAFAGQQVLAIAGIGNPERFFQQLHIMGLDFKSQAYSDHHAFQPRDFESVTADIVIMTEKDAVKCRAFAQPNFWVLPVNAAISDDLMAIVLNKLRS